jgi:hypothetical protein
VKRKTIQNGQNHIKNDRKTAPIFIYGQKRAEPNKKSETDEIELKTGLKPKTKTNQNPQKTTPKTTLQYCIKTLIMWELHFFNCSYLFFFSSFLFSFFAFYSFT